MIKVDYEVDKSVQTDKEFLLFDRNAFQSLPKDMLLKINKQYNILCPIEFIVECISPNNSDKKDIVSFERMKKALIEKLQLIQNPVMFTGSTNVEMRIAPSDNVKDLEYNDILTSWQIARNCIIDLPITMTGIPPDKLVEKCERFIWYIKHENRESTKTINQFLGDLRPDRYRKQVQKREELQGRSKSIYEIKQELRRDPTTNITQELRNAAGHVHRDITYDSKDEVIANFKIHFGLNNDHIKRLRSQFSIGKKLTTKNYPRLSYPIYIYFLIRYMLYGRQQDAQHLDKSVFLDFQYYRYLPFCGRFIADERSTPYIVEAIPDSQIRDIPIITSKELIEELT